MNNGFTLIELLVVITIVVVLLALLAPALDKAIYQAELAVCAAQQRSLATGVLTYAAVHRRHYPYRQASATGNFNYILKTGGASGAVSSFDDRSTFRDYFSIDLFVDPLAGDVDLDAEVDSRTAVYSTGPFWFGWQYAGHAAMKRIGDRWSWTDTRVDPIKTHRFRWLAGDHDTLQLQSAEAINSHPDDDGVLSLAEGEVSQYEQNDPAINAVANTTARVTYTYWRSLGRFDRGWVDLNFAGDDGAVTRYNDIPYDNPSQMAHVPLTGNPNAFVDDYFQHVPLR